MYNWPKDAGVFFTLTGKVFPTLGVHELDVVASPACPSDPEGYVVRPSRKDKSKVEIRLGSTPNIAVKA